MLDVLAFWNAKHPNQNYGSTVRKLLRNNQVDHSHCAFSKQSSLKPKHNAVRQ